MPAYNFQEQFADKVKKRIKRQTIRARRKDGRVPKEGEMFKGFTGMRTKKCRFLIESRISKVAHVMMDEVGFVLDGKQLDDAETNSIALLDGFEDADEMFAWFSKNHGLPFYGHMIRWL